MKTIDVAIDVAIPVDRNTRKKGHEKIEANNTTGADVEDKVHSGQSSNTSTGCITPRRDVTPKM